VLLKKSEEYATEDDKLHNFKIASALSGETAEQALWGFCIKHLVSISDMVAAGRTKQFTNDQWDEKIGDAINYLILLRAQVLETEMSKSFAENPPFDMTIDRPVKMSPAPVR
jgi:hypothetical protein